MANGKRRMRTLDRLDEPRSGRPPRSFERRERARARQSDQLLEEIFESGVKEGRERERGKTKGKRSRGGRALRSLDPALTRQFNSGLRLAGLSLTLIALFLILDNARTFSGVLDLVGRGLRWVIEPRGIPAVGANTAEPDRPSNPFFPRPQES